MPLLSKQALLTTLMHTCDGLASTMDVTSFKVRARCFALYVLYHLLSRTLPCLLMSMKKWICTTLVA
jgi:hypothetical protein